MNIEPTMPGGPRDLNQESERAGDAAPLADSLGEFRALADLEVHAASCTEHVCERCCRFACKVCPDGITNQPGGRCEPCGRQRDRDRDLAPALESLPEKYDWALDSQELRALTGVAAIQEVRLALSATRVPRVVLAGDAGSGKTGLAVATLRALIEAARKPDAKSWLVGRACGCRFVSAYGLSKARSQHPLGRGEAPLIQAALEATTLILDDLGSEKDGHASAVTEVLYERHAEGRVTWVTTWLTPDKATERYGAGISRRIFEGARIIRVGRASA